MTSTVPTPARAGPAGLPTGALTSLPVQRVPVEALRARVAGLWGS